MILMQLFYLSLLRLSSADDDCTFKTTEWNGQIKSPGYPTYKSGLNCKWHITVALGNVIELTFSDFAMSSYVDKNKYETNCSDATDFTEIYDGNTTSSRLLQKLCGWRKRTNLLTTQNNVLIHMKTAEKKHRGFLLEFQGVCNTKMTKRSDVIQSPNYPDLYPRATTCSWVIDFGYGMHVTLQFPKFDIEYQLNCTYDYVTLHQGLNIASPMLGKNYCGLKSPPSITVTGPLTLHFVSDLDTEYTGFVAQYFTKDRNECILGHECHTNAVCENTIGSYTCTCKSSFRGDGRSCEWYKEVNECSIGSHECDEQAFCVDTKDEYNCTCNSGFHGNGFNCSDINECDTDIVELKHQCHQNATCKNYFASYDCTCIDVYVGDGFNCTDRDECALGIDRCHVNAVCANTDGSYTCACKTGFQGDGYKCHDVNECKTKIDNCDENSQCHNTKGSYHCVCNDGYKGNGFHCEDINECELNLHDCHSDAECVNTNGSFYCYCKPGYEGNGTMCYDIDECLTKTHSCHGDAFCTNTKGLYNCTCNSGFQGNGKNCSDIDECEEGIHSCHDDATCHNLIGSYSCSCNSGFMGNGTVCEDLNECLLGSDDCHKDANCENTYGRFTCTCLKGLKGNGTYCEDIFECSTGTHKCSQHATCIEEYASYSCNCNTGYQGNGLNCSDINECSTPELNICNNNASCTNTKGSYTCLCNDGYIGDGFACSDVDECTLNNHRCHKDSTCVNTFGSYTCKCLTGFTGNGTDCKDINECMQQFHICDKKKGECINTRGSYTCRCKPGMIGDGIFCSDSLVAYLVIVSVMDGQWNNDMFDKKTEQFQSMSAAIKTEVDAIYVNERGFISSNVTRLGFGSIRATLLLKFEPWRQFLIEKIETSLKRGKINDMNVNPSSFEVIEIGTCTRGCSVNSYCSKNRLNGTSQCVCEDGYTGDGEICMDVNECENNNGGCAQQCVNIEGSFYCQCNPGFVLEVSQRKCQVNKSANIKHSFCAQDFSQGLHWKASIAETTISHKCPNNQIQGSATRYCNKFGVWDDPDLTSCVKPELTQIHGLVSSHNLSSITLSNVNKILKSLRTELHPSMNILYAGDLIRTQDILSSMMVFMKNKIKDKTMSEVETVLEGVGTILSYIICKKNHEAWYGIPQAFKRLNNHVVIIDMVAKIFSDYMIEEMSKNSTTHPEYLKSFNMAFTAEEMDLHINLVEMRRFNETSLVISSTTNQSYSVEYPSNMFQKDVDKLLNDKGLYTSIGCWADYSRHVTQLSLEGTHYLLKDHFLRREDAIHKCGVVAISLGYNVFTIQDGGLCASGPTLHLTYNKDGTANNCAVGKGGLFANSVYEINKFYTGILTTYHKHLGSLMLKLSPKSLLLPSSTQIQTYGELITSKILKYENKSPLDTPAKISFPQTVSNSSDVTCTQLVENNSSLVWSTNRCKTKVLEKMIECNCSRLAHQTLFYNYTKLPAKNDEDDEYVVLSYVSFGISTFCFLATLLTYSCSKMSRISLIFQANITIMTVITEVIFMFGIGSEIDLEKGVCKALTVLFHFFVTALFSWFLAQSWHSYHKLNDIIKQTYTERVYWYLFLGYGYPCVVSMISLGIFYDSYGIQTNVCWVTDTLLVAMLVPPLALLIILNTVILGMVVGVYFSPRSESSFPDEKTFVLEKDEICHVRDDIRASSILLPIVIATWVFAILHMLDKNSFAKYLFLLFNTLQGILYVIGYCLLNRKIMKRQMWSNPSSNYDSSLGSPNFPSLNMSKMRAIKNGTSNSAFETSPRLGKAAAYNGMNFMNMKRSIPSEVMYEMQQQWSRRKEEEEKEEEGIY
ncbi:uncharacterized protein LOC130655241 isoform X2 [Hydractinia symbiolongicarpus]|uniref:uncharacterized protein LOC130655241 isoform X2 n=1 Tax=Hydractinia symbiolongicarpus TaxID=13093 RepID=UPI00254CF3D3|nr:uncharacterized protein LOC130655241 isoform X2 [Hydractinia symbiolongicarpus]